MSGGERCLRGSVCSSISSPTPLPPAVPLQQIIPERAEISAAAAAPFFGRAAGVLGQAPTKPLSPKMELSDIAQDKPALSLFFFLVLAFIFLFIFYFTANVHVDIMVNIVTLIVVTVFRKRGFIIMNIIIIIIKGKQFCVARKTTLFFDYLSNSALSVQAILSLSVSSSQFLALCHAVTRFSNPALPSSNFPPPRVSSLLLPPFPCQ